MAGRTHRKNPLLRPGTFFVAPRPTDGDVVFALGQRLFQRIGLHDLVINNTSMIERIDVPGQTFRIGVFAQLEPMPRHDLFPEGDHVAELPGRVDMQQRKWRAGGMERLACQMQQDRRVLADRIEHHGVGCLGCDFAQNVDALGLEYFQMAR